MTQSSFPKSLRDIVKGTTRDLENMDLSNEEIKVPILKLFMLMHYHLSQTISH